MIAIPLELEIHSGENQLKTDLSTLFGHLYPPSAN